MPPIINAQGISKRFGAVALFREIAFTVSEGDRIGLIGPNGSGKSTLLGTLAGNIEPDSGEVAVRKRARVAYVHQDSQFPEGKTVREVVLAALREIKTPESEQDARMGSTLGRAGFTDIHQQAAALSGGWFICRATPRILLPPNFANDGRPHSVRSEATHSLAQLWCCIGQNHSFDYPASRFGWSAREKHFSGSSCDCGFCRGRPLACTIPH